jgi:hypothetical protein
VGGKAVGAVSGGEVGFRAVFSDQPANDGSVDAIAGREVIAFVHKKEYQVVVTF